MSLLATDLTKAVNSAAVAAGWQNLTQQFGLVKLLRYSWLEYSWGTGPRVPGTTLSGELAPPILVVFSRADLQTASRTLQGPTGWVEHEPGLYKLLVSIRAQVEVFPATPERPRISLVSSDEKPSLSWTSVINPILVPPFLIPGQAKYVFGHTALGIGTGLLVQWFQGQRSLFGISTRLQVNLKCRVPDGATHLQTTTLNVAVSFE